MGNIVTYNNLLTESWQNVYDLINNRNNVSDPITISTEIRKWVYSREPDIKSIDFKGFPYIIINPSTIEFGDEQTGNRKIGSVNWTIEIEVVTCDRGFNNRDGKGQTDNDSISDDIIKLFNSEENGGLLRQKGLHFFKPNVTNIVTEEFSNTLIYRRSFILSFKSKKKLF